MIGFNIISPIVALLFVIHIQFCNACSAGRQLIRTGGLSQFEKQSIVDSHNRIRQSVALGQVSPQPPAANMMEMTWDDELAYRAQRWADDCQILHDQQSKRDIGRFPVGQNIAATWTSRRPSSKQDYAPDFNVQIKKWFDENRIFWYRPISNSHGTGHYSQLVWGETSKVGCGFTVFFDQSKGYVKLYVCNYGPGGNVIGSKPYERGNPSCGTFGLAESAKYYGLCVVSYETSYEDIPLDNSGNFDTNSIPDSSSDYGYDDGSYNPSIYGHNSYQSWSNQKQNTVTYKPIISLFNGASNFFESAKQKTSNTFSVFKPTGFKFGVYL